MGCAVLELRIINNPFSAKFSACFLEVEVELNCLKCI
jgi:hypothetical protein